MRIPVRVLAQGIGVATPVILEILKTYSSPQDRQKLDEGAVLQVDVETRESTEASAHNDSEPQPSRRLLARIPTAEGKRRVIVVVPPDLLEMPTADSPGVALIAAPTRAPRTRLDAGLYRRGLLESGAVLIQSPMDANVYHPLEEAAITFALDKLLLYDRVAGLLGATKFSVEELQVVSEGGSFTIRGGFEAPVGEIKGDFDKSQTKKFQSFMEVGSTNKGGEPDAEAAQRIADQAGLAFDPALNHLIAVVRDGVRKKTQTIRLNLTNEAKRNLSLGAALGSKFKVTGSADIRRGNDELRDVQIILKVEFGEQN